MSKKIASTPTKVLQLHFVVIHLSLSILLLILIAWTSADADVVDHGDGNFTVSGEFVPAVPYSANGGTDATPTITVDSTTKLQYSSDADFFSIRADNYTVDIQAGADIENTAYGTIFASYLAGSLTKYNIAGSLSGRGYLIGQAFAGSPRWEIDLSGTLKNTYGNTIALGQGGADKFILQQTGHLWLAEADVFPSIIFRGGNDEFIVNGGTFDLPKPVDFGEGDDLLELNATPTGAARMLGGSGTDTVQLNNSGSYSLTALESGWEKLEMNGAAWTLSGFTANTFSGGVALNAGNLTLDATGGDTTISGTVSGAGSLTKQGTGTLTLSGANTYTGKTNISGGKLQISSDTNLGAAPASFVADQLTIDGGTLEFLIPLPAGVANLNANRGITLGSSGGTISVTPGMLCYLSVDAPISGSGSLTKEGDAMLWLKGANAYTGGTVVNSGILTGDTSSLQGDIVLNNSSIYFHQTTDGTYSGTISGNGNVFNMMPGTVILTGANTYTGGTIVTDGTIQGNTTSLQGDITNNASVVFDQAGDGTYAGVMSGTGILTKTGSGKVTLTGNNTFTGGTTVNNGVLDVAGSIGDVTITSSGTLCGTGSVGSAGNSGTVAPGASIGTLTITGDYTHEAGATYEVEVDALGNSDLIDVTGTATINGGTVDVRAETGTYAFATDYNILQAAGGVNGAFDDVTTNLAFLDPSLSYNPLSVILTLTRNDTGFASIGLSSNERAVGDALDRLASTATGDMKTVLNAVTGLSAPGARSAFNQMGGAAHAALTQTGVNRVARSLRRISRTARASSSLRGPVFRPGITAGETRFALAEGLFTTDGGPLVAASLGGGVQATPDARWGIWLTGNGTSGKGKGDDTAARYDYTIKSVRAGFDAPVTDRLLAGISLGVSNTDISYDELADAADTDSVQGALYGVYKADPWCVSGVFLYGKNDYQSTRYLSFGGITRTAQADYDGSEIGGFLEAGYRLERNSLTLEPCASLELSHVSQDGFTETGAGSLNLVATSQDISSLRSSLGLRVSKKIKPRDGFTLKPEASVHWAHEFLDDDNLVNARFSGSSAGSYVVRGEQPDRNSAILELGITGTIRKNLSFSVYVDAEAGSHQRAVAATAGIEYRW